MSPMPVAPPPPRLIPLSHLAAFEAAVRLGGFAAAGRADGVTPGAVRAKVRALELALGEPLFDAGPLASGRSPRGARALADDLARAFAGLARAFCARWARHHCRWGRWGRSRRRCNRAVLRRVPRCWA